MQKRLIDDIAYDLNLESYPEESTDRYYARVIYSAMSLWMKHIVLDQTVEDDEQEIKTKNYHYRRSSEIFEEFIHLYPSIKSWMCPRERINPLHEIRDGLIAAGEINEVNLNGDIALAISQKIGISSNITRVIGLAEDEILTKYTGLTKICAQDTKKKQNIFSKDSTEVVKDFLNPLYYSELRKLKGNYELFNVNRASRYDKHWKTNGKLDHELNLIRQKTGYENFWHYSLILTKTGILYEYPLNQELIKLGFHSQLMIGLRKIYGSAAKARFIHRDNIIELTIDLKLPRYEETLIRTYSWPKESIADRWSYIVPIEVWSVFQELLILLGYTVEGG